MQIAPEDWIDKTFQFGAPIGAFPAILERVRGTPARIEELIRSIDPDRPTLRTGNDWSILEHVGHLHDLDELHEGRLEDCRSGREVLRPADMTNRKTFEANHNGSPVEDLLLRFRRGRMRLVEQLEGLDAEGVARSAMHPRLGKPMRVIDIAQFAAEHDDHHLASIRLIARRS